MHLGELEDADHLADPTGVEDVGLEDVGVGEINEVAEGPAMPELLSGGDRYVQRTAHLTQPGHIVLRERLLEMRDAELLQLTAQADRRPRRVATICVEPEPDVRPQGVPDLARHLQILGRVDVTADGSPVHPDLERRVTLIPAAQDVGDHLPGCLREPGSHAPVERDRHPRCAPQQGVDREAGRLAHDVPKRDIDHTGEGGGGGVGEFLRAGDETLPVATRLERVLADQLWSDDPFEVRPEDGWIVPTQF